MTTPTSLPSDDSLDPLVRRPVPDWVVDPEPAYRAPVPERHKDRVWLHVLLFVLTLLSTTLIGALHYAVLHERSWHQAGAANLAA